MCKETRLVTMFVACGALLATAAPATAAPTLRHKVDQRGDFLLLGNTLAQDCAMGAAVPTLGQIVQCGLEQGDTSPDVFWRADDPTAGSARADLTITPAQARSTAVLQLPAGATVTYARLYWAGPRSGATTDTGVVVERVGAGAFSNMIAADASSTIMPGTGTPRTFYQATADVTALVQANGSGAYRVSGVDSVDWRNVDESRGFVAWSMVVLYTRPGDPPRNLTIFDGLDAVDPDAPGMGSVTITLSGFLVPNAGFDAKLGVVAYEGDSSIVGDSLYFVDLMQPLTNGVNPADNFFNSTRSLLGNAVSNEGDLPRLTGAARSMSGVDMDVVDVTNRLNQGDTSATIRASSTGDFFVTGVFVTSISTFKPDFTTTSKTYTNITRNDGTVRPGDVLEYTITTTNNGNDPGVNVVLTDPLPAGLTFEGTTINVTNPPAVAMDKTAAKDMDEAEYDPATRTVTVRLGTGANGSMGGIIQPGDSRTVVFRVKVDANAAGMIANQAIVTAAGQAGAPATPYPSDGNGVEPGTPPTSTPIDQCAMDTDCAAPKPVCRKTTRPWVCVECTGNANCTTAEKPICDTAMGVCRGCTADGECGGATPACHSSGRCTQCSATNNTQCMGTSKPMCDATTGTCAGCTTNADCSGSTPVCDVTMKVCRACAMDGECGGNTPACLTTGACGECSMTNTTRCVAPKPACDTAAATCVECTSNANCSGSKPFCDTASKTCRGCASDGDCSGATPFCNTSAAVCVACRTNADCGGLRPICSMQSQTCVACTSDTECTAKNAAFPACQTSGGLAGACTECSATNSGLCKGQKPQCLTSLGFCGCSDSDGDGECGGAMSGIVCNAPVGVCTPGCSVAPGRNGCPTGQACNAAGNAVGQCVIGACTSDDQCASPRPKCDTGMMPSSCVQCLANSDCTAPFLCDTAATKTCVECVAGNAANCSVNGAGSRCLNNNTCGCMMDNECGGATSGRVCDAGISKCSPGCRGAGGNGCPAGLICTSTDTNIGRCVPPGTLLDGGVEPDAGVDAATPDAATPDAATPDATSDGATADARPDGGDMGGAGDARAADAGTSDAQPEVGPGMDAAVGPTDGGVDAATGIGGYLAGGGCQCDLRGGGQPSGGWAWLAGLGLAVALRRRRRR